MQVSIIQMDISWGDIEANISKADSLISKNPGSDLYILPEMFSTGFCTKDKAVTEEEDGASLRWMKRKSKEINAAVAGSVATQLPTGNSEAEEKLVNRFYFVHPDGKVEYYDKRHLFTFGGEHLKFSPGQRRVVVEYKGFRILLSVCYDLRFPVFSRNRGDYDAAIYVASWPSVRIGAWSALLKARAIENQCFVAGVNRCGEDSSGAYNGKSVILDPWGETMAECRDNTEDVVTSTWNIEKLSAYKSHFPCLNDADEFTLV